MENVDDAVSARVFKPCVLVVAAAMILTLLPLAAKAQKLSPAEIDREANELLSKLTIQQKIELIGGVDGMFTNAMPSIGLPRLKMSDASVGVRVWGPSTAYAAGIGLAASWDRALARRIGVAIGQDARARGVNILLGPGVNIYRLPLDGRNFEFLGGDPYLASQMAVNYIEGLQSQDVVATIKHFALNNSEYDRHGENSIISERALHEIYLPTFEAAVKQAHVGAVMDSYNLVDGVHSSQNHMLNIQILKKAWGFRGILMSDWDGTYNGIASANNGLDLEMPSARFMNAATLLPALKSGEVSEATIDDKVRRILRVAIRFGFLNHDQTDLKIPLYDQQSHRVALQSAEESMVLLKNQDHLLPLDLKRIHSIAIIGPDAYPPHASGGGSAHVTPFAAISYMQGLSDAFWPHVKVYWSSGVKSLSSIFGEGGYSRSSFSTDDQGKHPGLTQEEYPGASVTGQPFSTRTVLHVDPFLHNPYALPEHNGPFAIRWSGYFTPKTSGPQRFVAGVAEGDSYTLYINGKQVLKEETTVGRAPQSVVVNLPAGKAAAVRMDYVSQTGRIEAALGVAPGGNLLLPNVKKLASMADVVVLSVGFNTRTEGEGHDRTYSLPLGQNELIKTVLGINPRTIIVVTSGGSVETAPWIAQAPVLIEGWYGGSEAGRALAAVLTGKVDPSGKLPISWEKRLQDDPAYNNYDEAPGTHNIVYKEGIFIGYRYFDESSVKPLFPFGFGLSYTTFAFSNLHVPASANASGPVNVSFDVTNTGKVEGAEVAQVYVGDPSASVKRPEKELKAFERVALTPGQTKRVYVTLDRRSFAYWDVKSHGWKVDPGKFVVYVGDSSENVPLHESFNVR